MQIKKSIFKSAPESKDYYCDEDSPQGSIFLVMPYEKRYSKLEGAIKNFFQGVYEVRMEKDSFGRVLEGICEKIKDADFGIVVLSGLKKIVKRRLQARFNIPFEYGMFIVLNKPVMLMVEEKGSLVINDEFSDIRNQHYEPFRLKRDQKLLEKQIRKAFNKFIPELANNMADHEIEELESRGKLVKDKTGFKKRLIAAHRTLIVNNFKKKMKAF